MQAVIRRDRLDHPPAPADQRDGGILRHREQVELEAKAAAHDQRLPPRRVGRFCDPRIRHLAARPLAQPRRGRRCSEPAFADAVAHEGTRHFDRTGIDRQAVARHGSGIGTACGGRPSSARSPAGAGTATDRKPRASCDGAWRRRGAAGRARVHRRPTRTQRAPPPTPCTPSRRPSAAGGDGPASRAG